MARKKRRTAEQVQEATYEKVNALPENEQQDELSRDLLNFAQGWKARDALLKQRTA